MHTRNKLNVRKIAALTEPNVYSDGGGLYLRVRPSGTKSWIFVKIVQGKRREFGLGSALDVSLAEARELAANLRDAFRHGRPPRARPAQIALHDQDTVAFGAFFKEYIALRETQFGNDKHRKQWSSTIHTYAAPILDKPIDDITTDDIVALLRDVWLEKPETARRVRGRIEATLNAAKVRGLRDGENPARLKGHLDLLLPRQSAKVVHHPALAFADLPTFMQQLRKCKGVGARALEFTILTASRTGETIGMTWAEIDFDAAIWTIPAERMKAGRQHEVPLSDAAVAILKGQKGARTIEPGDRVFHNGKGTGLSNMTMMQVLRRMSKDEITVHGFRSTFRDWAGDKTDFPRELAEMALAHQIGSKTERAYRRERSVEKRRVMMSEWAEFAMIAK